MVRHLYSNSSQRHSFPFRTGRSFLFAVVFTIAITAPLPRLFALQAKVTLRNGQIQSVDVVSANQNGIMWKGGRVVAPTLLKNDQIAFIDFPEPRGWKQALQSFHKQEYAEAITYFSEVANDRAKHYFPAPGNFCSQAMLHLVNCHIETGNYAEISKIVSSITTSSLPVEYRYRAPIIAAWGELGKGDFEKASGMIEAIKTVGTTPGKAELSFINAYALEKAGNKKDAIQAYGGVYSLDFGADTAISRKALENSIRLLEELGDENRVSELQALVHTYAHTFSNGDLFADASSLAHELLSKELGHVDIGESIKEKVKPDESNKTNEGEKIDTPKVDGSIITLDFAKKLFQQGGKESPLEIGGIHSLEEIKQGKKGNFSRIPLKAGVDLAVSGIGKGPSQSNRRLVLEPNKGLGVMNIGEADSSGEGVRMWIAGFDGPGVRIVSVTFGSGDADFALGTGDRADIEVQGLKPGQPDYRTSFSGSGTDEDFQTMKLSGGFISSGLYDNQKGGKFVLTQAQGRFFISSISLELEPPTSSSEKNESE